MGQGYNVLADGLAVTLSSSPLKESAINKMSMAARVVEAAVFVKIL